MIIQSIPVSKGRTCVTSGKSFFLKSCCDGDPAFSLNSQLEEPLSLLAGKHLVLSFFTTNLNFSLYRFKPNHSVFYLWCSWRTCRIARAALVVQNKCLTAQSTSNSSDSRRAEKEYEQDKHTWCCHLAKAQPDPFWSQDFWTLLWRLCLVTCRRLLFQVLHLHLSHFVTGLGVFFVFLSTDTSHPFSDDSSLDWTFIASFLIDHVF